MKTQPRGPQGGGSQRRDPSQERERIVDAFTKLAAERGYAKTTVEDVAAAAGVSRDAFDAHFSGKRQCLLTAYDKFLGCLVQEVEESMDLEAPWPQQVKTGVSAAIGFVVEQVDAARLFAIEAMAVGPPAIDRYQAAIRRIAGLLRLGRRRSVGAAELPALAELVLVAGAVDLVTSVLLAEDPARLSLLESQLTDVLLLPYADAGRTLGAAA